MTHHDTPASVPDESKGGYESPAPEDEVAGDGVAQQHEDGGEAEEAENEYGGYEAASMPKEGEDV